MKALLSNHARQRLTERTKLTEEQFTLLLDRFQTLTVGYEPKTHNWHRLFYSAEDKRHFVAVQEMTNGWVLTILPIDFAACAKWNITEKKLRRTMRYAAPDHHEATYQKSTAPADGVRFVLTGLFWGKDMKHIRKSLGTFAFVNDPTPEEVANCEPLIATVLQRLQDRRLVGLELDEIVLSDKRCKTNTHKLPWAVLKDFPVANDTDNANNDITGENLPDSAPGAAAVACGQATDHSG